RALQALLAEIGAARASVDRSLKEFAEGGIGTTLESFIDLALGFIVVLRQHEQVGEVEVRFDVVLICLQGGFKLGLGLVELLPAQIRGAQVVVSRIIVRRKAQSLLVVLNRVVRLALMVRLHALVKLFAGLLGKLPVVLGGINQERVAALDAAGEGIFLGRGAGDEDDLREVHRRSVGDDVGGFAAGL